MTIGVLRGTQRLEERGDPPPDHIVKMLNTW